MNISRLAKTLLLACAMTLPAGSVTAAEDVRCPENRVIYEVFVRNFSPEGNFKGVEKQIPRLKELGVDVIWLMPIYKLGDEGKWGSYSSPYAIKDYKAVDPDNGSEADLRSLISAIHANGMEVWFDWVGNHTSIDNVWVGSHPEYYGNNFYHPNGWNDVWQLDVNNSAMHEAMIDAMQYWVSEFDIDGFRCDYASGPSEEFWRKATSRVLKNGRRVAWLAEDDSKPELVSKGYFDYNYAWYFHDRLLDFGRGHNVSTLRKDCADLHNEAAYDGRSRMVYLSNHDVVQDKGGTEDRLFGKYLRPLTVLQFTVYGMPLIYNGQEIQYKSDRVSLAEKTPIDWNNPDNGMTELIKTLAHVKHTQPALRTGSQHGRLTNLATSDDNSIYAYKRTLQNENVVVMLNFNDAQKTFTVSSGLPAGTYRDVFTGRTVDFNNPGQFTLPAMGYAVWVNTVGGEITPPDPVVPDPVDEYYLYAEDKTGWNDIYVYAYNESTGEIEGNAPFGAWPGAKLEGSFEIKGRTYKRVALPSKMNGRSYKFIFNNNGRPQLADMDADVDGDMYFNELTENKLYIYILDNTGWNDLALYAWGDAEVFGTWPGKKAEGSHDINGRSWKRVELPAEAIGKNLHLIANNNDNGIQYDLATVRADRNFYYLLNPDNGQEIDPGLSSAIMPVISGGDEPAYYNMHGTRVVNPADGIFIEVRGPLTRKVKL